MDGDTTTPLTAVLRIAEEAGEADAAQIRIAEEQIWQHFDAGGPAAILDFTDVDYLTEEGIAALLRLRRDTHARGARLIICCLAPYVQNKINRSSGIARLPGPIVVRSSPS
jgi:anti-anti-sigma factor